MVVLESNGTIMSPTVQSAPSPRGLHQPLPYHHLQYVQPLPSEYDEKCDPLAMLTRACNKIETDLMKHNHEHKMTSSSSSSSSVHGPSRSAKLSLESPRSSTASDRPESSSPNRKPIASTSPIDFKVRPSSSSDVRRPTSNASSTSAASPSNKKSSSPPTTTSSRMPMTSPIVPTPPGVCVDPMCRDPTCPTTAARNAHFLNFFAGARGVGINPYFYPPTTAAMLGMTSPSALASLASSSSPALPSPTASVSSTSALTSTPLSSTTTSTSTSAIGGAFVCNWMSGSDFCGRRFSSSDDLMSHLRSHTTVAAAAAATSSTTPSTPPTTSSPSPTTTSSIPSPADTLAALQAAQFQSLYPALGSQSALAALQARAVSAAAAASSSLSPTGAARYHPYMRPGSLGLPPPPAMLPTFPFGHLPPHMAAAAHFGGGNPFLPYGLPPFGPYP